MALTRVACWRSPKGNVQGYNPKRGEYLNAVAQQAWQILKL